MMGSGRQRSNNRCVCLMLKPRWQKSKRDGKRETYDAGPIEDSVRRLFTRRRCPSRHQCAQRTSRDFQSSGQRRYWHDWLSALCLCVSMCVYQYRSSDGRVYGFFAWLASLPLSFSLWSTIEERTGWHSLKEGRRQFGQRAADLARTRRRSTRNTWWATAQIERNRNKNIEIYIIKFRRLLLPPVYDWLTDWLCMCVCVCVV